MADAQVSLLLKIQADLAQLKAVRTEFGGFLQEVGQGNILLSALGTGLAAGVGAGIGVAITKGLTSAIETIRESIGAVGQLAAEVERASGATGVSGTAYQVFSAVLRAANQDVSVLTPALSNLSKIIGGAGDASGTAAQKLAAIGLTFESLKGLSPEQQFEQVAIALSSLSDANERDAAASALLGRSYAALKPLIDALAHDGLGGLTKKVDESTGILNEEYAKALNAAGTRSEQAGNRISVALAPVALRLKEMAAHTKEIFANIIAGPKPGDAPKTMADVGADAAKQESKGKSPEEIQALLSKELQAVAVTYGDDPYNDVILARVKVFEDEIAAARVRQKAAGELMVAESAESDKKSFKNFEANYRKQLALEQDIDQSRRKQEGHVITADNKAAEQQRELTFTQQQAAAARNLADIQGQISQIEGNRFLTNQQKEEQIFPLLQKEHELLQSRIALLQTELELNKELTPKDRQRLQGSIDNLSKEDNGVVARGENTAPLTTGQNIQADLVQLQNQLGTFSQNVGSSIANTIGGAVDNVTSGIMKWVTGAMSFKQAAQGILRDIGVTAVQEFVSGFIKGLAQMLVSYITTKNSMFAVDTVMAAKGLVLSAASAAKSLIMWLPSAIAASISSWGIAAAIGAAAVIAIVASNKFDVGGYTPGGARDKPVGTVHAGEWVAPQWMVNDPQYGNMIENLEAVRQGHGGSGKPGEFMFGGLNSLTKKYFGGQTLGQYLGSGFLPGQMTKYLPGFDNFQKKWNLLDGTQLYGAIDPGGEVIKPTAAQLAASGVDQSHLDYLSTLGGPLSTNGSTVSTASSSAAGDASSATQSTPINVNVYAFTDKNQLLQEFRRDSSIKKMVIDVLQNNRGMVSTS